jgi:hypothetical protein
LRIKVQSWPVPSDQHPPQDWRFVFVFTLYEREPEEVEGEEEEEVVG